MVGDVHPHAATGTDGRGLSRRHDDISGGEHDREVPSAGEAFPARCRRRLNLLRDSTRKGPHVKT